MGGHGHGHDDHDDGETGEWMQLLKPSELREVQDFERARKEVERQIIHSNQAKLAGRSEAERRGRTPSSQRIAGAGSYANDLMSHIYSQDVDVTHLAKLLPRPGDGEKQKKLARQNIVDVTNMFLAGPEFGILTMTVTIASVCLYLYETTLDYDDDFSSGGGWYKSGHKYPDWFSGMEDFLLVFFAAELLLRSILADQHYTFWLSTETLVDVLSVMPSFLLVAFDLRLWGFLRFLRLLRWSDIANFIDHRTSKQNTLRDDEGVGTSDDAVKEVSKWKYESFVTGLKLLAFVARYVLVFAGAVLLLDRAEGGIDDISESDTNEALEFSSALYMAAMMLSTVGEGGYGPVPVSPFARVVTSIAVLVFLPLAAIRVADVIKTSNTSKSAMRPVSFAPGIQDRHVILCGSVCAGNLKSRLQELFHADHGIHNVRWVKVVVLSPDPPTARINSLLARPRYRGRVIYIQGSPLEDDSLRRARVENAAAVMVLANKTPRSSHAEDMNLSLQAISISTHVELERRQGFGPRLLVELVDPNAAVHLQAAGIKQVVSSAQLKLSILGQSCLCPGWSAVVANLLDSRAAIPPQALQQGSWLAEYFVGAKKTFYSVEFSPAYEGVPFADAVVHIFEHFELILAAVETKQVGIGDKDTVLVNPSEDFCIGRGDRGFVLAESWADARVIWDYMSEEGRGGAMDDMEFKSRSRSPEEEEALALETVGSSGVVAIGPQAFVDSMMFSRTLIHCQKRLPEGDAPDAGLVLEWARQFEESEGISDEMVVRKILANVGLVPPRDVVLSSVVPPASSSHPPAAHYNKQDDSNDDDDNHEEGDDGKSRLAAVAAAAAAEVAEPEQDLLDLSTVMESPVSHRHTFHSSSSSGVQDITTTTAGAAEEREGVGHEEEGVHHPTPPAVQTSVSMDQPSLTTPRPVQRRSVSESVMSSRNNARSSSGVPVDDGGDDDITGEEILSALRTMEVSSLTGEEACRRLLALRSAAKAAPVTPFRPKSSNVTSSPSKVDIDTKAKAKAETSTTATMTVSTSTAVASSNTPVMANVGDNDGADCGVVVPPVTVTSRADGDDPMSVSSGRKISTARHLVGHVVVLGFPARPSHLECFLKPLKGWTGGAGVGGRQEFGGGGVPVVLVAQSLEKLDSALAVVERNGYINTSEVYLLEGSPVSQADLENAGVSTAKCVIVMKDPRSRMMSEGILGDPLRDAESLLSFIKMEDGLLTPNQHVVVELESSSNVRFLHTRTDGKTLNAIAGLGGAGSGGAADEAYYMWPKYAAGMTYNSSSIDSLFAQAFYRPSRIALMERLLLLDKREGQGRSGIAESSTRIVAPGSTVLSYTAEDAAPEGGRDCCLRQMAVPPSFLGHSFGEMFQHLAAPPLRCVAFALLRARGTRNAPEPYVYTGPRADTVLHRGDRVFILGKPPVL